MLNTPPRGAEAPSRPERMDAIEFFGRTLPSTGPYCAVGINSNGQLDQRFVNTCEQLAEAVAAIDAKGANAYHGCAGYLTKGSRKADNVSQMKAFWGDLDVGDAAGKYPTKKDAVTAVGQFCKDVGLPLPLIVKSGRGLHVYWTLTEEIDAAEWLPVARMLKDVAATQGLKLDPSRTADTASILRPPGTYHRKGEPRLVEVFHPGKDMPLAAFRSALDKQVGGLGTRTRPKAPASINDDLTAGMEYPDSSGEKIANECGVIQLVRDTRGTVDQPTWYGAIGVLAFTVEGEEICHRWSDGHPQYTPGETDKKIAQALKFAPTTCKKLADAQPDICGSCPHYTRITSPIVLGYERDGAVEIGATHLPLDISAFSVTSGLHTPYKRRPVANGVAYRGEVTLGIGSGGIAKSTIILYICAGVTDSTFPGCSFENLELPVLMINAEDPQGEMLLRTRALYDHHGRTPRSSFYVLGSDNINGLVLTEVGATGREQVCRRGMEQLRQYILDTGAKLVVLDPLAALVPYGLNDNGVAAAVMRELKTIAQKCDAAIVLVAHTRKGAAATVGDSAEAALGAVAWSNLARGVRLIKKPDAAKLAEIGAQFDELTKIREVVTVKANMSASDDSQFYKIIGVPMDNGTPEYPQGDWVAVAEVFTPRPGGSRFTHPVLETVLRVLAQGTQGGSSPYSPAPQAKHRYFKHDVAQGLAAHYPGGAPGQLEAAAKAAYAECLSKGWVGEISAAVPKPGSTSTNTARSIRVHWSRTPFAAQPMPGPFAS